MWWMLVIGAAGAASEADVLTYAIGPGDELRLEVVGQPDMSGDVRVDAAGRVTIPLAQGVVVGGLTLDAAREVIVSHLAGGYLKNPQVFLDVKQYASKQVDVSGAITNPGTYSITSGETTVSRMLLQAGGLVDPSTPDAEVWRGSGSDRQVIHVDVRAINAGDPGADLVLQAGDHLFVKPMARVFVDGVVGKPGTVAWRSGLTVTEAVIEAGGALGTARLAGVYILRGQQRIPVNLKRVQRGVDADVVLQPDDKIVVPESAF